MDNPGLQPPITPSPPVTPPPPLPVQPETPVITPPPNPTYKKAKKVLPKLAVGTLVMALLIGGLFLGKNLLQEKQRPVEKLADDCGVKPDGTPWICASDEHCCNTGCSSSPCADDNQPIPTVGGTGGDQSTSGGCVYPCNCPDGYSSCLNGSEGYGCNFVCSSHGLNLATGGTSGGNNRCSLATCTQVVCVYCVNDFRGTNCKGTRTLPTGVSYSNCDIHGSWCGTIQCDGYKLNDAGSYVGCGENTWIDKVDRSGCGGSVGGDVGEGGCVPSWGACSVACGGGTQSDGCGNSQICNTQACPSLACVGLTKDIPVPTLGDQVTFTCEATFNSADPTAFFRYSADGGTTWDNEGIHIPIEPDTHKASYGMAINKLGNWVVQCKVCTDSTATTCTVWGVAN